MPRTQSRPKAGAMDKTIYARISEQDYSELMQVGNEKDRSVSWLVRQALIDQGYISDGKG